MEYEPVFFDIETTGLNPMKQEWWNSSNKDAAVLAVAVGTIDGWRVNPSSTDFNIEVISIDDTNAELFNEERNVLKALNSHMRDLSDDIEGEDPYNTTGTEMFLVGFNSRYFDHQWLGARYARQRLNAWPFISNRKRLDMKNSLRGLTGKYWKQDDYAEKLGLESKDEITGADVPDMYDDGRIKPIERHAHWDLKDLMRIFLENVEGHMQYFYDHYDMDKEANFRTEVQL